MYTETKLYQEKVRLLGTWWDGPQVWAPTVESQGGVTILLHKNLDVEILDHDFDQLEQWAWVLVRSVDKEWAIVIVYAPTDRSERKEFFEALMYNLPVVDDIILAGDWNAAIDDSNPILATGRAGRDLVIELDLLDSYRLSNGTDLGYTWFSSQLQAGKRVAPRRLDFFMVSKSFWSGTVEVTTQPHPISDHNLVVLQFLWGEGPIKGKGIFR